MASIRAELIGEYWISTAPRTTYISNYGEVAYYETMAWEWDAKEKLLGKIVYMGDSGNDKKWALKEHNKVVNVFRYLTWRKRRVVK